MSFFDIQLIDERILEFIHNNLHNNLLDRVMVFITNLGHAGIIWIIISCILILQKQYRKVGIMVMISIMLSRIIGEVVLKNIICRQRPCVYKPIAKILVNIPRSYSFPSSHSFISFAAATILAKEIKKYALLFLILATLIAFSRVYLYVHYPSDIMVGSILGGVCGYSVWKKVH